MRHAALGGGKRVRPFLVIECAGLFGVQPAAALNAAAALECVHCYSLVHDDLPAMDDDDLRRGRPTVHKAFDEWTAILAGDALLTVAFELLASPEAHPDAAVRAELALGLARASGACRHGRRPMPRSGGREARPAAAADACRCAAPAGHEDRRAHPLCLRGRCRARRCAMWSSAALSSSIGERLGRAFQIADDLLDVEGEAATIGKATGKDAGKATLVSMMGVDAAKAELAKLEAEALPRCSRSARADVLREAAAFVVRRQA